MAKKKKSSFRGKVNSNAQKQKQGQGAAYGYLNLPKGIPIYKEKPGSKALLDIMPYVITDKMHMDREFIAVGDEWYKKPFKTHRNVGVDNDTVVCPTTVGKKCPICEYRAKRAREGAEKEELKAMNASFRNLYVVIPLKDKENEEVPHIWDISTWLFQNLLTDEIEEDVDYEVFPDLEEGLTLKIRFDSKSFGEGKPFAEASRIDFLKREAYDEDIMEDIPDLDSLLTIKSYKEIEQLFFELDEDEDAATQHTTEDEEDEEKPKRRKPKPKKEEPAEEEDEDGDGIPEGAIECVACDGSGANSKGRKCRICKGAGYIIPEEDEDEDEEEKPTRRKKSSKADDKPKRGSKKDKCPHGHKYGVDTDDHDECDDCELWDACIDKKEDNE